MGRVIPEHEDRICDLRVDDYIWHGVGQRPSGDYEAAPIELYGPDEQAELQKQSGFPVVKQSEATPEVLSPANRVKTLRQLIEEKRNGNLR